MLAAPVAGAVQAPFVNGGLHVELNAVSPREGLVDPASRTVIVSGRAPRGCAPSLARATLERTDFSIELTPPAASCAGQTAVPFSIKVDPLASAGLPFVAGQVYRTRVYLIEQGAPSLVAFRLLDPGPKVGGTAPENGMWWSEASADTGPALPGNGASIEYQNGQLAVGLLGFADSGAANWTFGTTWLAGRVARLSMVQLAAADSTLSPASAQPTSQAGPRLEIDFESPSHALAYVVRTQDGRDIDVRSIALSRARFENGQLAAAWAGRWVLVADEGQAPRVFDFADASTRDEDAFHLTDATTDTTLECRLASGTAHPQGCSLSTSTLVLADFDQVGLDHLTGHDGSGARVTLMRVPR